MTRILVVDDDDQIRALLREVLERDQFEVMDAADGDVALALQRKYPADLIITDLIMPAKDGIETIMEFRKEFPAVEIIAISGGGPLGPGRVAADDYLELSKAFGGVSTFSKPIDFKRLLDKIRQLLALDSAPSVK